MLKIIAIVACALCVSIAFDADAKGRSSGGRVSYGGGKHTTSHGGTFVGGSGSSHKGALILIPRPEINTVRTNNPGVFDDAPHALVRRHIFCNHGRSFCGCRAAII
jgi:hypothetical protein